MPRGRNESLTPREWAVLALVHEGLTNEQIAARLGISRDGVKYHVSEILSKLHLSSRVEAASWYQRSQSKRRLPALALPAIRWHGRSLRVSRPAALAVGGATAGAVLVLFVLLLMVRHGDGKGSQSPVIADAVGLDVTNPTPVPRPVTPLSAPMMQPRYVTVWDLPEVPGPTPVPPRATPPVPISTIRPYQLSSAAGTDATLPALLRATLNGDAAGVRQAAAGLGSAKLHRLPDDDPGNACSDAAGLCLWAVPILEDQGGEYWAIVSGGRAVLDGNQPYPQFVAVFERYADGSWSDELARVTLKDPDICTAAGSPAANCDHLTDLAGVAWDLQGTGVLTGVGGPGPSQSIISVPVMAPDEAPKAWLLLRGSKWAASFASVFYALRFDSATDQLAVVLANGSRRAAADLRDLDGDGIPEVLINDSDAYAFCGACIADEQTWRLFHWRDGELVGVDLELPAGLAPDESARMQTALDFANAGLWLDAAASIDPLAQQSPDNDGLAWLARQIDLIATARIDQAARVRADVADPNADGDLHDVLVAVLAMAGDYDSAVAYMASQEPHDFFVRGPAFKPNGDPQPSFYSLAAGQNILRYTDSALAVAPDRAAIHAVRALGLVLSQKPDSQAAAAEMAEAARLDPGSSFYPEVLAVLNQ